MECIVKTFMTRKWSNSGVFVCIVRRIADGTVASCTLGFFSDSVCRIAEYFNEGKRRGIMSRNIWSIVLALGIVWVAGCAAPLTVDYDYDTMYDFSKLKTFALTSSPPGNQMEEFTEKRFQGALTSQLQVKGYNPAAESPDFLVSVAGIKKTVESGRVGVGASVGVPVGSHGSISVGGGRSKPKTKQEGELSVLLTERASGKPIWKGMAAAEIKPTQSPEEQQKLINAVVAELLKNFPPKPAR
jgi:hypothetical protein